MEIIVITKNGKTFIEQSKELYEKNKKNTEKDGYRLATKSEIEARASKNGFKPEVKEETKPKIKAKPETKPKDEALFPHDLDEIGPDQK